MKRLVLAFTAVMLFSAPAVFAADQITHEEVVSGIKATFKVLTMAEGMKSMGLEMPNGIKETHHIMIFFKDVKTGKVLTEGRVKMKVQTPGNTFQTREMMSMQGHFGADFILAKKGKYGFMTKFLLKDGKVRQTEFWYTVK